MFFKENKGLMMTGYDLQVFFEDLLYDFMHLASADLLSLGGRVLLLVIGMALFVAFIKFIFRVLYDLFGGVISWLWDVVTTPFYGLKRWRRKRKLKKQQKIWEAEKKQRSEEQQAFQVQREQERHAQQRKAFEKIMNQSPDLSRFKTG